MSQIQTDPHEMNQPSEFRASYKALIEKYMGEINQRLLESLPGSLSSTKGINETPSLNQVLQKLEQESDAKNKANEEQYENLSGSSIPCRCR